MAEIGLASDSRRTPVGGSAFAELGANGFRGHTRAYGLAHFGKSLFWYSSEILFAFFLTEVGGLSGHRMGAILATGLLASVVIDLGLAWAFRGVLAHAARAGALQVLGAGLSAGTLGLLFLTPWVGAPELRFAFAAVAMLVFRFAYALYDLPQNVLLGLATASDRSRTRVAAMRLFFSGLAALTVSATVGLLVADPYTGVRAGRFLGLAAAISVLALATAWGLHLSLRTYNAAAPDATDQTPPARRRPNRTGAWGRAWPVEIWILLAATFIVSLTASLFSKLEPYFAAYVLGSPLWGGIMITTVALGMTLSQPAWAWASARWSRPAMFAAAAATLIVGALTFLATVEASVWAGTGAALLFGAGSGGLGMVMWAAFGDAVAGGRVRSGGLAFALFTGASKIALALSVLMLGAFLNRADYRGSDSEAVLAVMTLWPTIGGIACLGLALTWKRLSRSDFRIG